MERVQASLGSKPWHWVVGQFGFQQWVGSRYPGSLRLTEVTRSGLWEAVTAMFTRSRPTSPESEDFSAELAGRLKKVSGEV